MLKDCFHIRWHNKYYVNKFLPIFYVLIWQMILYLLMAVFIILIKFLV